MIIPMKGKLYMIGLLLVGVLASSMAQENSKRDISAILSKNEFEEIVQFILDNGDRQTYCNMYNNNPHYGLEEFRIYLNPISQWINYSEENLSFSVSDYDEIVIVSYGLPDYYCISTFNERVWIDNVYKVEQIAYENKIILEYIPKLKLLITKK